MDKHTRMQLLGMLPAAFIAVAIWSPNASAQSGQVQRRESAENRYADGVYTATGQYGGGPSFITVTVTLQDGIVTKVAVRPHATVPRSLELQRSFADAVPRVVVGKPIDRLRVGKLAGSSHTPVGFNAALQQIRQKARQ